MSLNTKMVAVIFALILFVGWSQGYSVPLPADMEEEMLTGNYTVDLGVCYQSPFLTFQDPIVLRAGETMELATDAAFIFHYDVHCFHPSPLTNCQQNKKVPFPSIIQLYFSQQTGKSVGHDFSIFIDNVREKLQDLPNSCQWPTTDRHLENPRFPMNAIIEGPWTNVTFHVMRTSESCYNSSYYVTINYVT